MALAIGLLAGAPTAYAADPEPVGLGAAATFAVLAGTPAVTNSGSTIIDGDLGIFPAAAVTGFPPGTLNGSIHAADAIALQAKVDLVAAYDEAAGRTPAGVVAGGALGGMTLVGGVYNAGGVTLDLTGTLTLDGRNDPNSVWIFQATSHLITAASSSVELANGAQACNVLWQVAGSATLGADSSFAGNIVALTSITMLSRVTLSGRALVRDGSVTLMNDTISYPACIVSEPAAPPPVPIAGAAALAEVALAPGPTTGPTLPSTDLLARAADAGPGRVPVIVLGIVLGLGSAGLFMHRRWLGGYRAR
ncbi:MAG TPA: ice-binding family protein [Candidatus Sulfomarinibacteraceae bacterium]|nr:ice-binding family protein [Candidatus Sulfomarinibacteraceae bacterium]